MARGVTSLTRVYRCAGGSRRRATVWRPCKFLTSPMRGALVPDFSVVVFRLHFMLVSEEHLMKPHKNQWLLNLLSPLLSLGEPRTRVHTMVSGVQAPSQ